MRLNLRELVLKYKRRLQLNGCVGPSGLLFKDPTLKMQLKSRKKSKKKTETVTKKGLDCFPKSIEKQIIHGFSYDYSFKGFSLLQS